MTQYHYSGPDHLTPDARQAMRSVPDTLYAAVSHQIGMVQCNTQSVQATTCALLQLSGLECPSQPHIALALLESRWPDLVEFVTLQRAWFVGHGGYLQ